VYIFTGPGLASCRCRPLSSNVRRHYPLPLIATLMKIHPLAIPILALIGGCASAPPSTTSTNTIASYKRIGVVSVVADNFVQQYVGITVFGNERSERSLEQWNIDSEYETQLQEAASKALNAEAIAVGPPRSRFLEINNPAFGSPGPNITAVKNKLAETCSNERLDAIVVASKRRSGDIYGGTNQFISGAGIYSRGGRSLLHMMADVTLFDCKSSAALATRWTIPSVQIEELVARQPMARWSPTQEQDIRTKLVALPAENWRDAIHNMLK
jgi:hypothetical protein